MKKPSVLLLILAGSFILFLAGLWWGLPDSRGWAPDEITPSIVIDGLRQGFSNGWSGRYPPFHFYILSAAYSPFLVLHEFGLMDLSRLPNYTILFVIGRLLSVLMGLGIVALVYKIGREIMDRMAALSAAALSALIVPLEYYAKTVNLDVPYLFWFALSLLFYVRILKGHRLKDYVWFAASAALAITTKDQAYGLYLLAPFPVIIADWRRRRAAGPKRALIRSLFNRATLAAAATAAGVFVLVHNFAFNFRGFLGHVGIIIGGASVPYRMFPRTLSGEAGLLGLTVRQIQGSLGWPAFLLCLGGLAAVLVRKKESGILRALALMAASYYIFYISLILYNYDRFNLPICLVLSFFGGWAFSAVWRLGGARFRPLKAAASILLFAYGFLYASSVDILMIADSRYETERWMRRNVSRGAVVGRAGPMEYAPRLTGYDVVDVPLSLQAFRSGPPPDYIVFAPAYARSFPAGSPEGGYFSGFASAGARYAPAFRSRTDLPWLFIRYKNAGTNIDAVNIEIQVYRRTDGKAVRPEP